MQHQTPHRSDKLLTSNGDSIAKAVREQGEGCLQDGVAHWGDSKDQRHILNCMQRTDLRY
jgi:hypothetical protein